MTTRSDAPSRRAPCIVGVGQVLSRSSDPRDTEPLELWARACSLALADARSTRGVRTVDSVAVVRCDSWSYDAPAQRLAARLGLSPGHLEDSPLGGCQPQHLLHTLCDDIAAGRMDLGLVVSGEALFTLDVVTRAGEEPGWGHRAAAPPPVDLGDFFHNSEVRHGMLPIMRSFALRDVARRAQRGDDLESYAREPATTYAAMSTVAAANPYAWHPSAKDADEILEVGAANRMPVRPYPKLMMASPKVNLAAAVLVAGQATADDLGVPADRRVYLRGWSSTGDHPLRGRERRPLALARYGECGACGARRRRPGRRRSGLLRSLQLLSELAALHHRRSGPSPRRPPWCHGDGRHALRRRTRQRLRHTCLGVHDRSPARARGRLGPGERAQCPDGDACGDAS